MTRTLTAEHLNQIKADIAARKAMPEYGESVEGNIERLRVIGATRSHFSTETVEVLVRALEEKMRALADAERERDDWVEHSRRMEYRAIEAKELLANREAQPVGFRYRHKDTVSWLYNDWRWPDSVEAEQCQIEWLYTAPPAPAVAEAVIPGGLVYSSALPEFESNDSDKVIGYHCFISGQTRSVESQEQAYADAKTVINAFRATVLQNCASDEPSIDAGLTANKCENCASVNQPVSQGYALPESWIACSERMPNVEEEYYLTFSARGVISVDYFFDGYFADQYITHWMPLPAAPEGGNG